MIEVPLKFTKKQMVDFDRWWKEYGKKIEISEVSGPVHMAPPREEDTPRFRPALWPVKEEDREKNLQKYVKLALDLGAADAKVVRAKSISQDLRAQFVTCLNPVCRWMNTNDNCPMHRKFDFEDMKEFLGDYKHAIAFKYLPPQFDTVPDAGEINLDRYYTAGGGNPPDKAMLARNIIRLRIINEITRRLRAAAYYDGYMMASPMGISPCLVFKCAAGGKCTSMGKGEHCPFVDVAPSGNGVAYVDYFRLARKLGWGELQVGGNCAFPEDTQTPERYYNIGLVLID